MIMTIIFHIQVNWARSYWKKLHNQQGKIIYIVWLTSKYEMKGNIKYIDFQNIEKN